jgi:Cytochrome c3
MRPSGLVVAVLLAARTATPAEPRATSCTMCHARAEVAGEASPAIVEHEKSGAHAGAGLSCHDCHGGNPDPALAESLDAMDEKYAANPFRGAPKRAEIPAFCGRCHSDPTVMKHFKPAARVDQEREYWTSRHGELLKQGDVKVATCVDCHGTHGILPPADIASPVHPRRVADTCSGCHSDAARMAAYRLPDGRPLPVDQFARWRASVHAEFLLEREDLSAPTCNDCHGNHGAQPPGLESVAFVCGQCHAREAELFRASPKKDAFESHRELMAGAGEAGCADCHEQPQARLRRMVSFTECATCHGNHGIARATVAMLSPLPDTPCEFCHEPVGSGGELVEASERVQRRYESLHKHLLEQAAAKGLEGAARFDWLVEQARALPVHTQAGSTQPGGPMLRPEFLRLFTKFRIGKTHDASPERPGQPAVEAGILRCADCHGADAGTALETGKAFVEHMRLLTTATARAERLLLAARRGGVEVRQAVPHVDAAVAAQIELEVLIHGFSSAPDGAFLAKYREGIKHAESAVAGARTGLDELGSRRRGLLVFLGLLAIAVVAMVLKIRQLSQP